MSVLSLENFQQAVTRLGGATAETAHSQLMARWEEPTRHYHTLQHLEDCLELADAWGAQLPPTEQAMLVLALWFHDAVYDTHGTDNELKSAELARRELAELGVASSVQERVAELVMATAHGSAPAAADDFLANLLVDIDLAIQGSSPERFAQYEAQVRDEYGWVDEEAYAAGRGKVMGHFSAMAFSEPSTLYRTACGRTLLPQARVNLAQYPH